MTNKEFAIKELEDLGLEDYNRKNPFVELKLNGPSEYTEYLIYDTKPRDKGNYLYISAFDFTLDQALAIFKWKFYYRK